MDFNKFFFCGRGRARDFSYRLLKMTLTLVGIVSRGFCRTTLLCNNLRNLQLSKVVVNERNFGSTAIQQLKTSKLGYLNEIFNHSMLSLIINYS